MPAPFIESPRFPQDIALESVGRLRFNVSMIEVDSGAISRNLAGAYERGEWQVAHVARPMSEFAEFTKLFRAARGTYYGFRFWDPSDYVASSGEGVVSLISSGLYQMMRRYTYGAVTYDKPIYKPYGTITVLGGGSYTVDSTLGRITVNSGANPTGWTGAYDKPVIFASPEMEFEVVNKAPVGELIVRWPNVLIRELLVL